MRLRLLLFFSGILLLNTISCDDSRTGRILNRDDYEAPLLEQQTIQEYSQNSTVSDASFDDVIDEIIDSSRQGRNIEGLDDVYADPIVKEALLKGDDTEARNLIRDKLCDLGLMECEKRAPPRYIYTQPPNQVPGIYSNQRPPMSAPRPHPNAGGAYAQPRPPPISGGVYGQARPVPLPGQQHFTQQHQPLPSQHQPQYQPPRKVGYAPSNLNSFVASKPGPIPINDKFSSDFYDIDTAQTGVKFGYTERPTIVVNQGKREASQSSTNTHVHHHYVHVDGNGPAVIDGQKTVLVNTPISEYSAVTNLNSNLNQLSGSYQTSGFGASGSGGVGSGGFSPSATDFEYKGVNSGSSQGIYGAQTNVKPVFESNQFGSGQSYGQQQANLGPQVFTDGSNGIYSNNGQSFHSQAPDFYKKELNLNGNRGNSLGGSNSASYYQQQQNLQQQKQQQNLQSQQSVQQQQYAQKYSKNQYNQGENYQGGNNAGRQDEFDCDCVPFEQCSAQDVVGRRDDLILPLDPRHLSTEIEAEATDSNSTLTRVAKDAAPSANSTEAHKVAKRAADDVQKVDGEGRLFGFGGGAQGGAQGGYYPNNNGGHGGKQIIPTLGVSFGLPYPTHGYPLGPGGFAPNPHFGAISPNGLNLGLLNVNPLFSLQVTKSEHGQKLVKPFVNLHVTPSENIIGKIGGLFAAKKGALHKHYHHHQHRYPPPPHHFPFESYHQPHFEGPPPHFDGPPHHFEGPPHHFEGPPQHFEGGPPHYPHLPHPIEGPILSHPPPHFNQGPIFSKPPHFHKELHYNNGLFDDVGFNPANIGFRSNNVTFNDQSEFPPNNQYLPPFNQNLPAGQSFESTNSINDVRYARQFSYSSNDDNQNFVQSIPAQAPGSAEGSDKVTFPSSRRRRDTDQVVPASIEKKENLESVDGETSTDSEGRALSAEKRQAFYQQPKQCGPRAVCCRKPYRAPHQQQFAPQNKFGKCGVRNAQGINGRIKNPSYVDGNSEFGEYPWQAAILKKDPKESVYVCGGTLIDNNHIITAAHCVKTYSGFDLRVRLGEWDVNHDVEFYPYVERDVISVHVHPEYYAGTLDNDLAILKLNQPVDFSGTPHISPACLPDKFTDFTRQRCWTTGWGKDNWDYGKYQNILKEVDVPIIDQNTCQNQLRQTRLGYNYALNPGFICAGGEEGKDACKGDGGGPLVCERNGVWQVAGIVSWGIGCGKVNVPGVYVRVSHYLDWISQITQRY